MSTTTPNMGLLTPSVNDADYPTSTSDSYTTLDSHDHTTGKGVQIPTGGIVNLAVTTAKIADTAVTTAKIADSNVTTAKIADGNITIDKIANSAVTGVKIADGNVSTVKIADANVTPAKLAGTNATQTASCGSFTTASNTLVAVTNLSGSFVSNGRNVFAGLETAGVVESRLFVTGATTSSRGQVRLYIDGTAVGVWDVGGGGTTGAVVTAVPCSSFFAWARGLSAGSHTYEIQTKVNDVSSSITFENIRLVLLEMF